MVNPKYFNIINYVTYYDFVVASEDNHSESDCFACAFLTHGSQKNDEDIVYGEDNFLYNNDIFALFKGDNCRSLVGKPKFFIFQVELIIIQTYLK